MSLDKPYAARLICIVKQLNFTIMTRKELVEKTQILSDETFELHTLIKIFEYKLQDKGKTDIDLEIASDLILNVSSIIDKIQILLDKPF